MSTGISRRCQWPCAPSKVRTRPCSPPCMLKHWIPMKPVVEDLTLKSVCRFWHGKNLIPKVNTNHGALHNYCNYGELRALGHVWTWDFPASNDANTSKPSTFGPVSQTSPAIYPNSFHHSCLFFAAQNHNPHAFF